MEKDKVLEECLIYFLLKQRGFQRFQRTQRATLKSWTWKGKSSKNQDWEGHRPGRPHRMGRTHRPGRPQTGKAHRPGRHSCKRRKETKEGMHSIREMLGCPVVLMWEALFYRFMDSLFPGNCRENLLGIFMGSERGRGGGERELWRNRENWGEQMLESSWSSWTRAVAESL